MLVFFYIVIFLRLCLLFFFFNDTATTEIYTLSLHDALPIYARWQAGFLEQLEDEIVREDRRRGRLPDHGVAHERGRRGEVAADRREVERRDRVHEPLERAVVKEVDRKSTRLNSSHSQISYAVFC